MKGTLKNPEGIHLSESAFRRYEHILIEWLQVYPEPFTFQLASLATSTAVVGLRNAINAVLTHKYETTIDLDKLQEAWHAVQVVARGTTVVMATPEEQKTAAIGIKRGPLDLALPLTLTVNDPSEQVLLALCILINARVLTQPITLTGTVPHFDKPAGIVLEHMPDDTYILF